MTCHKWVKGLTTPTEITHQVQIHITCGGQKFQRPGLTSNPATAQKSLPSHGTKVKEPMLPSELGYTPNHQFLDSGLFFSNTQNRWFFEKALQVDSLPSNLRKTTGFKEHVSAPRPRNLRTELTR